MNYETIEKALLGGESARVVPALCLPTLASIARGGAGLRAVRHPLGFFCLPVQRTGGLGVCIHVWTTALRRTAVTTSGVHSHSWDLASFVLYGVVGNAFMEIADDYLTGTHRIFRVRSLGEVDEMQATRRLVRCVEQHRQFTVGGSAYYIRAGAFHESVLDAETEAATVVLGRSGDAPDLSLGRPDIPTHRVARQLCDAQETAAAAQIVIDQLADRASAGTEGLGEERAIDGR
jgi:hypothetical protein